MLHNAPAMIPTGQARWLEDQPSGLPCPHLAPLVALQLRPLGLITQMQPIAAHNNHWWLYSIQTPSPAIVQNWSKGTPERGMAISHLTGAVVGASPPIAFACLPQEGDMYLHVLIRLVLVPNRFRIASEADLLSTVRYFALAGDAWYYHMFVKPKSQSSAA